MDLNALSVFHQVATLGGVGAAARKLKVTQPAVSQRLRALEKQLGKKLYGRADNRFVLTEDGRALLTACQPAFDSFNSLGADAPVSRELQGTIRIISLSEFAKAVLFPRIKAFRARHPGVRFEMEYRHPYEMMPFLLRHQTDFVFTNEFYRRQQIETETIFTEEYVFVGPRPARRFSWRELGELPWLSCSSEDPYWHEFQKQLSKNSVRMPPIAIELAEIESLLMLASQGVGYALVPRHALELRSSMKVAVHRIPFGTYRQPVYASRLRSVEPGRAARAFWDFLLSKSPVAGTSARRGSGRAGRGRRGRLS